jgi:hypothetical protein
VDPEVPLFFEPFAEICQERRTDPEVPLVLAQNFQKKSKYFKWPTILEL